MRILLPEYRIPAMGIHSKHQRIKVLKELLRKSWHFFAGVALIVAYSLSKVYFGERIALAGLVLLLLGVFVFEHVRIEYKPRILTLIDVLFRKKELNKPSAMMSFMISAVIVFAVFDYWIAFTAMMMLVVGDSFSAAVGRMFGRKKIRRSKTYAGTFAGLLANLLTGMIIMREYPEIFVPMAFVSTFVETYTNKIDDNLTVPISAAFTGFFIVAFFNISLTIQ